MLQSMKHRGPDSTGYAVYGPADDMVVIRFVLAEPLKSTGFGMEERLERNRAEVESRLAKIGAEVATVTSDTGYAFRATIRYGGDLKALADYLEDVPGCEVLSLGSSLEIIKDLGDAETVSGQYDLGSFRGTHGIGPRPHGHRVRGRPGQRPPLLGLPVRGRGRGPQRPAHQLPTSGAARLEQHGHRFQSECDSEIIAGGTWPSTCRGACRWRRP